MEPFLTLLIPNYNRPEELSRLLQSFFLEIEKYKLSNLINVVVVDDFSTENLDTTLSRFKSYENFFCFNQNKKCGNAERAFLSALDFVETEYVWLFGNDDELLPEALKRVMNILQTYKYSFVLLNPVLISNSNKFVAINTLKELVSYETARDLFSDFGFMSSTTTFSCLVMKTEPIKEFYKGCDLTRSAAVYSHSFSLYAAFKACPAAFVREPCVAFTMSSAFDEQTKLQKQAPNNIMFYHQTLGLMKLIYATSRVTNTDVSWFGSVTEDEINKITYNDYQIPLSFLILRFTLEQLIQEQINNSVKRKNFAYLSRGEVFELRQLFCDFQDLEVLHFFNGALQLYSDQKTPSKIKVAHLKSLQDQVQVVGLGRCNDKGFLQLSKIKKVSGC